MLSAADLRRYQYFSSLSDSSLDALSRKLSMVTFPRGSAIVKEGAAFLLKNHGLRARCLRGGINAWNGPAVTNHSGVHLPAR